MCDLSCGTGTIIYTDRHSRSGFILCHETNENIYFDYSMLKMSYHQFGDIVIFDVVQHENGNRAENISKLLN